MAATAKLNSLNGNRMFNLPVNMHLNGEGIVNVFHEGDEDESISAGYLVAIELHQWKRDDVHRCFHHDRVVLSVERPNGCVDELLIEEPEADRLFYGIKNYAQAHGIEFDDICGCLHYGDSPDSYKSWYDVF